jgi:N-acetylglucosamine-6-sulfatase
MPPNVVFIVTDDMRLDQLWAMPVVTSRLAAHGITFTNAFVPNPWCCPSRASILTGTYSHTNLVYRNAPPYGGYASFRAASTLATWLHDAGYHTGLVGKYLNGYRTGIPPGWDEWHAFSGGASNEGGAYYDYDLVDDGVLTRRGRRASDYSTDVLADRAETFIRDAPAAEPLFLYFTPFAPHGPSTPADRHATAFSSIGFTPRPPSFNEPDVSDKPAYIRMKPSLTGEEVRAVDTGRRKMLRTLLAVDEAVDRVLTALADTGRLGSTLILFSSDNGLLRGEHRWTSKVVPYEEAIRVPLVIRYDPLTRDGATDGHLVLNVDWAPTVADLAGIAAPGADGRAMTPLLSGRRPRTWRRAFPIEHLRGGSGDTVPSYCGVRTRTAKYVAYANGEEELYDLVHDPYEVQNLADDGASQQRKASLRARAKALCSPVPPGFSWERGSLHGGMHRVLRRWVGLLPPSERSRHESAPGHGPRDEDRRSVHRRRGAGADRVQPVDAVRGVPRVHGGSGVGHADR